MHTDIEGVGEEKDSTKSTEKQWSENLEKNQEKM